MSNVSTKPLWAQQFSVDDSTWQALCQQAERDHFTPLDLALEMGLLNENKLIQWDREASGLASLRVSFFSADPPFELWKKVNFLKCRMHACLPVGTWDGVTIWAKLTGSLTGMESENPGVIWVLAPWSGMKIWFKKWETQVDPVSIISPIATLPVSPVASNSNLVSPTATIATGTPDSITPLKLFSSDEPVTQVRPSKEFELKMTEEPPTNLKTEDSVIDISSMPTGLTDAKNDVHIDFSNIGLDTDIPQTGVKKSDLEILKPVTPVSDFKSEVKSKPKSDTSVELEFSLTEFKGKSQPPFETQTDMSKSISEIKPISFDPSPTKLAPINIFDSVEESLNIVDQKPKEHLMSPAISPPLGMPPAPSRPQAPVLPVVAAPKPPAPPVLAAIPKPKAPAPPVPKNLPPPMIKNLRNTATHVPPPPLPSMSPITETQPSYIPPVQPAAAMFSNEIVTLPLDQLIPRLKHATTQDSLAQVLIGVWQNHFDKVMILLFQGENLAVWWQNNRWKNASIKGEKIPLDGPSIFKIVNDTAKPYHGHISPGDVNDLFFQKADKGQYPEHITLIPVAQDNHVVAMLLGTCSKEVGRNLNLSRLEDEAATFASAMARVMTPIKRSA